MSDHDGRCAQTTSTPLPEVLAYHGTFSNPVADCNGLAKVAHMLGPTARVLAEVEQRGGRGSELDTVCAFNACDHEDHLQEVLLEGRDQTGRLVHVRRFWRLYETLGKAIAMMRGLLAQSPLPGNSIRA